jgi:hypothetical protein
MESVEAKIKELNYLEIESVNGGSWLSYFIGVLCASSEYFVQTDAQYYSTCMGH